MTQSLGGLWVVSDMDSTLLTAQGGIPQVNRDVIRLFCARGGHFTVATGRSVQSVQRALGGLALSGPAICCGGSVLYDFARNACLERHALGRERAQAAIHNLMAHFPTVGVEVWVGDGEVHVVRANAATQAHLVGEGLGCVLGQLEDTPQPWVKAVFMGEPALLDAVQAYAEPREAGEGLTLRRTDAAHYELLAAGISKASGLRALAECCHTPPERIVFIGGDDSSLDAMAAAGHAVAVAGAPGRVKLAADAVTVTGCADGAVGEFLYGLMRNDDET